MALAGEVLGQHHVVRARSSATVPSPTSISACPDSVMEYCPRGAQCQGKHVAGGRDAEGDARGRNKAGLPTPWAPSVSVKGRISGGASTIFDCPSVPL